MRIEGTSHIPHRYDPNRLTPMSQDMINNYNKIVDVLKELQNHRDASKPDKDFWFTKGSNLIDFTRLLVKGLENAQISKDEPVYKAVMEDSNKIYDLAKQMSDLQGINTNDLRQQICINLADIVGDLQSFTH